MRLSLAAKPIPLSDGSGLRLTMAKYYTPKDREIHGKGIVPDVVVEDPPVEQEQPTGSEQQPQGSEQQPPRSRRHMDVPDDDLSKDPQLQKAVETLKTQVKHPQKSIKAG